MVLNNTEEEFFKYLMQRVRKAISSKDITNFKYFSGDWENETDCKELVIRYVDSGDDEDETESESELE